MIILNQPELFFIISCLIVAASFVISVVHPLAAVMWLIAVFILSSIFVLWLNGQFLAWLLIIIYAGAIVVLFIFVVMMFDLSKMVNLSLNYSWFFIGLFSLAFFSYYTYKRDNLCGELIASILTMSSSSQWSTTEILGRFTIPSDLEAVGSVIYTVDSLYFCLVTYLLLLAIFGAVCVTNITRRKFKLTLFNRINKNFIR